MACVAAAPGVFSGGANVIAVGVLLAEFGMFRQALLRDQVRLYAAQSVLISVLAVVVAAARHLPELYALAGLSFALKAVVVPLVLRRMLRGLGGEGEGPGWTGIAGTGSLSLATTVLIAIAVAAFGVFSVAALPIRSPVLPSTALAISVAVVLVAFVLMIMRRDVPLVLQPVFAGFSILSPSWLWIVMPGLFGLVALTPWALSGRRLLRVRRVRPWLSATAGVSGRDSYTAFGFANPTRRVLAAVLHTRPIDAAEPDRPDAHVGYRSDIIEVVEEYLYRPLRRPFFMLVRLAQRLQSGRLDAYLAYLLIALIAVLAVVTALH